MSPIEQAAENYVQALEAFSKSTDKWVAAVGVKAVETAHQERMAAALIKEDAHKRLTLEVRTARPVK